MGDRRVAISPLQGFDRERNLGSQGVAGFAAVALGYCISPLRGFKPTATTYGVEQTKVVQGSGQTHGSKQCHAHARFAPATIADGEREGYHSSPCPETT